MSRCRYILFALLFATNIALHAETATYSVTSYHAIALSDGVAPEGSVVTFNSTTARGAQITAGNAGTLTISGYDAQFIRSVTLQMHSNKSAGSGSLTATLDGTVVATIADASFADASWNGAYVGSDTWVDIPVPFASGFTFPSGGVLTIVVEASANSLYVGGCVIEYRAESILPFPFTVGFITGTEEVLPPVTETAAGKGVLLPSLSDADSTWHFLGWTEAQLPHTEVCPAYQMAGTCYFPSKNTTLYALYTNKLHIDSLVQDTLFETGMYAIVSGAPYNCMMQGTVEDKKVFTSPVTLQQGADSLYRLPMETVPADSRYYITFSDSAATIQHVATNSYIGYNATSHYLRDAQSEWEVMYTAEHSLFFHQGFDAEGYTYGLHPTMTREGSYYQYTKLLPKTSDRFLLLFAVSDVGPKKALYTTNPRSGVGLKDVEEKSTYRVFRLDGTCVMTGATKESLRELTRGIYIICSPRGAEKRIVR